MYKHILVPTDGSKLSLKALKEAAALAARLQARVTVVHVTEPWMPPVGSEGMLHNMSVLQGQYKKAVDARAKEVLERSARVIKGTNVACETLQVVGSQSWDGIITAAKRKKCDLIVMASHGRRGLAGLLLGSETVKVLTHSKTPVLVCR